MGSVYGNWMQFRTGFDYLPKLYEIGIQIDCAESIRYHTPVSALQQLLLRTENPNANTPPDFTCFFIDGIQLITYADNCTILAQEITFLLFVNH